MCSSDLEDRHNTADQHYDDSSHHGDHNKGVSYGIPEKEFLDNLDKLSELAFDDQCTGGNARYPLISEIKDLYLKAYYGEPVKHKAD